MMEGGGGCKKVMVLSWWKAASASTTRLLCFIMLPLVLVSGMAVVALLSGGSSNPCWFWTTTAAATTKIHQELQHPAGTAGKQRANSSSSSSHYYYNNHNTTSSSADDDSRSSHPQPTGKEEEERFNVTVSSGPVLSPLLFNETHAENPLNTKIERRFSNLQRLEAQLGQARAAIRHARFGNQTYHDPDYIPAGPIYWNANIFHRSYLEMEKQFKIYVYDEGEPPIFHNGPCKSIYAMEGNFIYHMETTQFRTRDPEKAHIFFLSMSVTQMVHFIYDRNSHHWLPMRQVVRDYVNLLAAKYPYWNRSKGADHFMLACHDWGPELSKSVPELYKNSIRGLCNANTSEGFNPSKDVSFPEILLPGGSTEGLIGGPSPSRRKYLAFFAGGLHGPIRPVLLEHWENKDEDVQVHKYLKKGISYYGMLRNSKYCLCPSGYEVASPRMVEALYTGCVPVIIKDHYVPPFSDVLNWKSFSVEIPVKEIPNLKAILMGISSRQYIRLQRRGQQVRRHFEVNLPPKRYDVFHMILHSVWLRRLNLRLHGVDDI